MMINNGMPNILQLPYSFQVIKLGCFACRSNGLDFRVYIKFI